MTKKQQKNNLKESNRLREIIDILVKREIIRGLTAEKLRQIIEDLGPTYIKLGQIMSMRSDILSLEYCVELAKLRTEVAPMDFDEVVNQIEDSLGGSLDDCFSQIEEKPIGSASIAQVHKGKLLDGTNVVVKVQRKGIYEIMSRDIALLRRASKILKLSGATGDVIDFNLVLDELWKTTQEELDFLVEAKHIERFNELNKDINYVKCPKAYRQYSSSKILVLEHIQGIPINDHKRLVESGYDLEEIGEKLSENYVKQIVENGYFHADPHPGNIIISGGKIAWIDFGMMGNLTKRDKDLFLEAVESMVQDDIGKLKEIILILGETKGEIDHPALYSDIDLLMSKYSMTDINSLSMGNVINDIMNAAKKHNIAMPANFSMVGRGVSTLEGVMKELGAEISFLGILGNHIRPNINDKDYLMNQAKKTAHETYKSYRSLISLPALAKDVLRMLTKGQSKLGMELNMSSDFNKSINKMIDNIVTGLIIASLLISSSLIATTDMLPKILGVPALGALGYIVAIILSVKIIISMFKYR